MACSIWQGFCAGGAVRPQCRLARKARARSLERLAQLRGDDDMSRRGQVDAMRKRGAAKLRVEERHGATHRGDAEPDRQVIGAVRHQERDGVALCDALVERPARIAIGAGGEVRKAHGLVCGDEGGGGAAHRRPVGDDVKQKPVWVTGNWRGRFQGAHPVADDALNGAFLAAGLPQRAICLNQSHAR